MNDALGNEIVLGRKYGYSSKDTVFVGIARNFTKSGVTLTTEKRRSFLYGKENFDWHVRFPAAPTVTVASWHLFPVSQEYVGDSGTATTGHEGSRMRSHELAKHMLAHPDVELILQRDADGNGYSPLRDINYNVVYVADTEYSGTAYVTDYADGAEENDMTADEWADLLKNNAGYAVLVPLN